MRSRTVMSFNMHIFRGQPKRSALAGIILAAQILAGFNAPFLLAAPGDVPSGAPAEVSEPEPTVEGIPEDPRMSALEIAGHIIPVIPTWRSINDRDRRFYMLVETPGFGLLNEPPAQAIVRWVSGKPYFEISTVRAMMESYVSFQISQFVRNGINLDPRITNRSKAMLSWWISTLIYGSVTGIPRIVEAHRLHDSKQMTYAISTVLFAALWPMITTSLQTYLFTPYFYSRFPKATLLKDLADPNVSRESLLDKEKTAIEEILAKAGGDGNTLSVADRKAIEMHQHSIRWIEWYRRGISEGDQSALARRRLNYWTQKSGKMMAVAVTMISAYFFTRNATVGGTSNEKDWGPLTRLVESAERMMNPNEASKFTSVDFQNLTQELGKQIEISGAPPADPMFPNPEFVLAETSPIDQRVIRTQRVNCRLFLSAGVP